MSSLKDRISAGLDFKVTDVFGRLFSTKAYERRQRANALADFIEKGTVPWNYRYSTRCYIGQLCAMLDTSPTGNGFGIVDHYLLLSEHGVKVKYVCCNLLIDSIEDVAIAASDRFTKEEAIKALRFYAETGTFQWGPATNG